MQVKRLQSSGSYVIELLVVNDWTQVIMLAHSNIIIFCIIQLQRFGGDVQSAVMRAAEIVNGIDTVRNCLYSRCNAYFISGDRTPCSFLLHLAFV